MSDLASAVEQRLRQGGIDLENSLITMRPEGLLEAVVELATDEWHRLETHAEIEATLRHAMMSVGILAGMLTNHPSARQVRAKGTIQSLQTAREFLAELAREGKHLPMFNVYGPVLAPQPEFGALAKARRLTGR